jgi:hypothetical protein
VKSHRHTPIDKQRTCVRQYFLGERNVCKAVYAATYGLSYNRIVYVLDNKTKSGTVSPDKRGRKTPANKIPDETLQLIVRFLDDFPKYKSHYTSSDRIYFHPQVTMKKLLQLFLEAHPQHRVSMFVFRKLFHQYNVSIYIPKKDTCSVCDCHQAKRKGDLSEAERTTLETESKEHLKRASSARNELRKATELSKENPRILAFTFDLEKTQPLPYINTSSAFYKRQMWVYNLGINNRRNNKGVMCMWTEVEGKRGSNEVASSIQAFLNTLDLTSYDEIRTFSDGCGGQNRNRTVVSLIMHTCSSTPITKWTHCYLETGHSYLPNDTDFGKIEKSKSSQIGIYSFDQWVDLVKRCKFDVIKMKDKFDDFSQLSSYHTFRTHDTDSNKFSWLSMKWLRVSDGSDTVEYKTSCSPDDPIRTINFGKHGQSTANHELVGLYPNAIPLKKKKYDDIMSLLKFVPYVYSSFFQALPHEGQTVDEYEAYPDSEEE